jgi:enoyl-CoA hydratase/carnithine racemase
VPVIAGIHGVAYGGGLQIALAADMRIVAPDARLSVMEIKWGLVPDITGTQTLRHLVRDDVARELTFTGRIVSGEEARELGLATRVDDNPQQAAYDTAMEIASKSPDAIRADKQLLNAASLVSLEEGLQLEARLQASLIGKPNQVEAAKANLEKRAPSFENPE